MTNHPNPPDLPPPLSYLTGHKHHMMVVPQCAPGVGATTMRGSASMVNSHSTQARSSTALSGVNTSTCHKSHRLSWDSEYYMLTGHLLTTQARGTPLPNWPSTLLVPALPRNATLHL